jgi:hypothetical protein
MAVMRKLFIVVLILLVLGGLGFYFGWTQRTVPPGSYGVLRSKTHGLDSTLIREGEVRWVWYKLIPTNTDIQVYRPGRVEHRVNHRGTLPSADVYSSFAGISADFSYEFDAIFSFNIGPDSLIPLIRERNIQGQEELDAYTGALAGDIEQFILQQMESLGKDEEELRRILETGTSAALEGEIRSNFPYIEGISCRFPAIRFPDFLLYAHIRDLYHEYLDKQRDYMGALINDNAERHIDSRFRLDELASYGELLTRYPVLLDYLKLQSK